MPPVIFYLSRHTLDGIVYDCVFHMYHLNKIQ